MLFNSYLYLLLFLPLVVSGYFAICKKFSHSSANIWLLIASLLFYSVWDVRYLALLLTSILVNYLFGMGIIQKKLQRYKKVLLTSAITFNLGLLGFYKYTDFFISNINQLTHLKIPLQNIILPLGISFFTFTQIAFLVDSYRGKVHEYKLINYMLFISFFPHLLAGPIIHHADIMPQFNSSKKQIDYHNMLKAVFLLSIGLFKKIILADTFAIWATQGFDGGGSLGFFAAWQTSLSYTLQIYFDFSGYSDMAIASALFFNIVFPQNFCSPYRALNIQDFWRRWHMTLSAFLRDYLYIPLGGNRAAAWRVHLNLVITFVLGGLWHGANWTFVFWGLLHGIATIVHRVWQSLNITMPRSLAWLITFNFINITWIFFRAKTWPAALHVLHAMFVWPVSQQINPIVYGAIAGAVLICVKTKDSLQITHSTLATQLYSPIIIAGLLTLSIIALSIQDAHVFLYFQF